MLGFLGSVKSIFTGVETNPGISASGKKPGMRIIILLFFFLSGSSGLIYQVVWNRMLSLVFGSTTFAMAIVFTAFMGGMAMGSFYFGRLIDQRGNPLILIKQFLML